MTSLDTGTLDSGALDGGASDSGADCPPDVVDRLLWRNAQRILNRHAVRLDGSCHWCRQPAPCDAHELALRAAEVARLPWPEAWRLRNEISGLLPVIAAELRQRPRAEA